MTSQAATVLHAVRTIRRNCGPYAAKRYALKRGVSHRVWRIAVLLQVREETKEEK
jgi:hypothetical protein